MDRQAAQELALKLMSDHALNDWSFGWHDAESLFGCARFEKRQITLSRRLVDLNDEPQVRDIVLHEIAHVLAGEDAEHGWRWVRMAHSIGCSGSRTWSRDVVVAPLPRWEGRCPTGEHGVIARRRALDRAWARRVACNKCCDKWNGGRFDEKFRIDWVDVRGGR